MKRVLVITPCAPDGLPSQGEAIATRLTRAGVSARLLGRAASSWGRLLVIGLWGFVVMPFHDVALVNLYGGRAFVYESAAILSARLWRRRSVVLIHGGWMPDFVQRWPRWTHFVLARAHLILVPHEFLRTELTALGIQIDGVIPNFVELEHYRFRERRQPTPTFLYLRGMHTIYNPMMAIRAFGLIQQRYPDAILTMAGPESAESDGCRALVQQLKLRNVSFVGRVPKEAIPSLAEQHDIHLHTNRVENMPVSVLEMWACGLPIVGTSVGGMPYLVRDQEDAILVPSNDHEAMADACLQLLADGRKAGRLSRNGRARVESLTWETIASSWFKALALDADL